MQIPHPLLKPGIYMKKATKYDLMKEHLSCDWTTLLKDKHTEENGKGSWTNYKTPLKCMFQQKRLNLLEHHDQDGSTRTPWDQWGKKTRACKKWRETNMPEVHSYTGARNHAELAARKAVKQFEARIASKNKLNPKSFWKYVNDEMKSRQPISVLGKENGELIPKPIQREVPKPLVDVKLTGGNIKKRLFKLKTSKSPSPCGLHPQNTERNGNWNFGTTSRHFYYVIERREASRGLAHWPHNANAQEGLTNGGGKLQASQSYIHFV